MFRKAQLHCHTTNSDGRLEPRALLERYRARGYAVVVFTDHDRVTACDDLNDAGFLALPGVETTVSRPFRPLGPHMGRLGAPGALHAAGAQACIDATIAAGLRFGIVVSRFNSFITERLLAAALDALERSGAGKDVDVAHVPGSFELPLASRKLAATGKYDALIAVGCILRGETAHYDYVCSETARGLQLAQMDSGLPIIFCVLTCDTLEQAIDRAGLKGGNKGFEAGLAAIEMAQLSRKLRAPRPNSAPAGKPRRK
jgi:6,7-dimethyl-8-ribityllumazine synthase